MAGGKEMVGEVMVEEIREDVVRCQLFRLKKRACSSFNSK